MTDKPDDVYDIPREQQRLVLDLIKNHPKRRGELRAEYERRILRLAREKA